jgi:Zn-finger nucleic acid-binding protein
MMNCPACQSVLERVRYEGFPVMRCSACRGYLLAAQRADAIKRKREKDVEELKDEVLEAALPDSHDPVRCPRCHGKMDKQWIRDPASFLLDKCEACDLWWFDAGEIARYQLAYQISAQGREAAEMQERFADMSDERKEELARNIQRLPQKSFVDELLGEMFTPSHRRHWHDDLLPPPDDSLF